MLQFLVDQCRSTGLLGPQLAAQGAAQQLCLYLQGAQWRQVEGQIEPPEAFPFTGFVRLLVLDAHLHGHDVLLLAYRQLHLPSGQLSAIGQCLVLRQAGQLMALQTGYRRRGEF